MGRLVVAGLALVGLVTPVRPASAEELPQLAVMDLKGGGVSEDLVSVVSASVARAARDTEAFSVISGADIRALLSLEAQKQLCGVDSESCLAEIGGALGADYMIQGGLKKVGEQTILDLVLMEVAKAKVLNRVSRTVKGDAGGLIDEVPNATVQLLSKALEGRLGSLIISVSEPGSSVKIDGRIVGVSPLGEQKVPAGVHLVEVEKTGFITAKEQVVVKVDETVARGVQMVPSPDFLESYAKSAKRMRLGAWISAGATVVALGAGGYFHLKADATAADFKEQRDLYNQTRDRETYDALSALRF
ncbi:MAG: PEGA domain-containing protein [Deltaproteobacteria bacterium]|nr:PEGA domain-containing protein [Deltaproteobacteria bacterium]